MSDFAWATDPGPLIALTGLLGLLVGSFLNVVILRLPKRLEHDWRSQARELLGHEHADESAPPDLVRTGSHCPSCKHRLSALDNVLAPTLAAGTRDAAAPARARQLLADVGLADRADHRPAELSGGERQRVAIARALIRQPMLLLCDEPTGNLDRASAASVADLLVSLHRDRQTMLVVVTHSPSLAERFDRRYELDDRRLQAMA